MLCANSASWIQFALGLKKMPPTDHRKSVHDVMRSGTVEVGDGVVFVVQVKDVAHECITVVGSGVSAACPKCGLWAQMG